MCTQTLINNLLNSELYPHNCKEVRLIETHISWVILTGDYVYKIKKPVDFGFLDFSTLEKRKHFCQQELKLNSKLAKEVYLGVLLITGSEDNPQLDGEGDVIEYAIRLKEFPQSQLFDKLLENEKLNANLIGEMATALADFHQITDVCDEELDYGTEQQIHAPVKQNFDQVKPMLAKDQQALAQIERIEQWTEQQHQRLLPILAQRKQQGFVRACHGDAHLGNIALIDGRPVFFDCIEFNEDFRWTDTIADVSFLAMDLEFKNNRQFANHFVNQYCQQSGDYQGLAVLDYYKVYRAMVRGKIALFQLQQDVDSATRENLINNYRRCFALAESYTTPRQAKLIITQGVTASGKSTVAKQLATQCGLIQIRADRERKRMLNISPTQNDQCGVNQDVYSHANHAKTYQYLATLSQQVLQAGFHVIVDASFIKQQFRQLFTDLAEKMQLPFNILHTYAATNVLREKLSQRQDDISESYLAVLEMQLNDCEALTEQELAQSIHINTEKPLELQSIIQQMNSKTQKDALESRLAPEAME